MQAQVATLALLLAAGNGDDEPLRASLEVDATAVGEGGEALEQRIETRGQAVLREAEVLSARDESDPVVRVTIEALPEDAGYRCVYELRRRGEAIDGTQASSECRLCTDVELETQVTAAIERLVPKLPRAETAADDASPPPPTPIVDAEPRAWTIGRMGQAGIGVTVVGAGVLGVGLGLAVSGASSNSVRTSGIASAAIGGAILVTGIVLLAVDRARSNRVSATATGVRVNF